MLINPFLRTLSAEFIDLTYKDYPRIQVAFDVYKTKRSRPELMVFDIEMVHDSEDKYGVVSSHFSSHWLKKIVSSRGDGLGSIRPDAYALSLTTALESGVKPSQKPKDLEMRMSNTAIEQICVIDMERFKSLNLSAKEMIAVGAMYTTLNNGYLIIDGKWCKFKSAYQNWMPPLIIRKIASVHPYPTPNKKTKEQKQKELRERQALERKARGRAKTVAYNYNFE